MTGQLKISSPHTDFLLINTHAPTTMRTISSTIFGSVWGSKLEEEAATGCLLIHTALKYRVECSRCAHKQAEFSHVVCGREWLSTSGHGIPGCNGEHSIDSLVPEMEVC